MTQEAVTDLLAAAGYPDEVGWITRNISAALTMACGPVNRVEVVYDTTEDGASAPGVVTEVLLHTSTASTLLIAAEAYSATEWHLFDESVVALPDLAAADRLTWIPTRKPWRSTEGHLL